MRIGSQREEQLPFEDREAAELFDFSLISSIETDVVPFVGDSRVPDELVMQLARTLYKGSQLTFGSTDEERTAFTPLASTWSSSPTSSDSGLTGSTAVDIPRPREKFSYWCLDLLFSICSDTEKGLLHYVGCRTVTDVVS